MSNQLEEDKGQWAIDTKHMNKYPTQPHSPLLLLCLKKPTPSASADKTNSTYSLCELRREWKKGLELVVILSSGSFPTFLMLGFDSKVLWNISKGADG